MTFHHHDVVGSRIARKRLQALKFDNDTISAVTQLIEQHLRFFGYSEGAWSDSAVRRYVRDAGEHLERLHILEGYLKAVDSNTGKELYRFKTPSGIIGNVMTYTHGGKQYVAVLSGVGGWAGIGLAAGLTNPTEGLGAVGGYAALSDYTALGGTLTVFSLPN